MQKREDFTGKVFGRLTVIDGRGTECVCMCECGNRVTTRKFELRSGNRRSCGCLQREGKAGNVVPARPKGMTRDQVQWARCVLIGGPDKDRAEAGLIILFHHELKMIKEADASAAAAYHRAHRETRNKARRESAA